MKTLKYVFPLFLLLSFSSCDFLDKDPYELTPETFYNNEAELQSALVGAYSPLMQEHFYGDAYALFLSGGDDLSFYQRSSPKTSILCANANSGTPEIANFWRILYDGINRANLLIENIDKNPEIPLTTRDRIRAEAKFLRAFYYFNLVQGWGSVPVHLKPVKSVKGLSIPRTDKEDIYTFVIKDIEDGIPYLSKSNEVTHTGYVTQSAAQGILARIYLFRAGEHVRDGKPAEPNNQENYVKAAYWASQVKNSLLHDLVYPYSRVFMDLSQDKYNSTGARESIWEAEEAGNRINAATWSAGRLGNTLGFGSNDFSTILDLKNLTGMKNPGYSYRFIFASLKLYEMYDAEGDTERGNWNIAPFEYTYATTGNKQVTGRLYFEGKRPAGLDEVDGMPCKDFTAAQSVNKTRSAAKYRREYELVAPKNKNYTPINFPILRYSDVLLMLAEAENEVHGTPTPLAYECLKLVRDRAGLSELSGLDKQGFLDAIKKERAMELCFEGLRRWDLIRWGDFYNNMIEMPTYISKTGWNPGHAYASNYYRVTKSYTYFPIPDSELSTNKAVKQNSGW